MFAVYMAMDQHLLYDICPIFWIFTSQIPATFSSGVQKVDWVWTFATGPTFPGLYPEMEVGPFDRASAAAKCGSL